MEEKLYFKPASYGKGIKNKEKPVKKKEKEEGEKTHRIRNLVLFLLFIAVIVIIILWLLHGKTTTTGQYPANVKNESLECVSTALTYPKLGTVSPAPKETNLTLTAVFSGEDTLRTISVKNLMTFESNSEAVVAEARTHANFNIGLRAYNYGTEKFENKFSIMSDKLLVNLTAKSKELDEFSKGYFLITSEQLPTTLADFKQEYEAQGFTCRTDFNEN
ncbi:hypothetical protein IKL45_02185 [Candidatus Saccharibacteria bacterium]|nr:hypothetical protein [Candidatus Saccharibacteria bacterium]MBR6122393.1 hypothetical protein [Candidatus Saccharibacteria bacterium]